MKILDIIKRALDFGTLRSRENFLAFTLKSLVYIIPAVLFGNYTDITILKLKEDNKLGDYLLYYILLQTLLIILTLYIILRLLSNYTSEFQVTIAGGFFSVLYFGMQTNYIDMIKEYTRY
jgi:hypothetical protein